MATDTTTTTPRHRGSGVNSGLTPRRVVETSEYVAFVRRAIAALGRRVATGDVEAITELAALSSTLDAALTAAVTGLRASGYSWAEIGERLGTTRQAVQKRWGHES